MSESHQHAETKTASLPDLRGVEYLALRNMFTRELMSTGYLLCFDGLQMFKNSLLRITDHLSLAHPAAQGNWEPR